MLVNLSNVGWFGPGAPFVSIAFVRSFISPSVVAVLVVTDATFRGTKVRVIIDTGSEVTMGNEALRRRVARAPEVRVMAVRRERIADLPTPRELRPNVVAHRPRRRVEGSGNVGVHPGIIPV